MSSAPAPIICAQEVGFRYVAEGELILDNVSFTVNRGEFVAIRGASGSGKTSLLNLLGTLSRPSQGRLNVCGLDTLAATDSQLSALRNSKIGFVFQSFHLDDKRSVLQNIMLPLYFGSHSLSQGHERALTLLRQMGIDQYRNKLVSQLSGGQRQRVALIRAMICNPELLLADEPLGHLDDSNAQAILHILAELNRTRELTVLLTTHDHRAETLAQKTIYLERGKICAAPAENRRE